MFCYFEKIKHLYLIIILNLLNTNKIICEIKFNYKIKFNYNKKNIKKLLGKKPAL